MVNGVFDTRAGTIYDDDITSRYHFPNRYLPAAQACLGERIIYREPQRNAGRASYVAVARVLPLSLTVSDPASATPG